MTTQPRLTRLAGHLGARVEGLALDTGSDGDTRAWLLPALREHKVLVLPAQRLDASAFHDFARGFGPLQTHVLEKYRHESFADLSWLTNVAPDGSVDRFGVRRATAWHSDGSYTPSPPAIGILYALEVPSSGGGTLFADMSRAFETLPARDRAALAGLTGLHRHGAGPDGNMYDGSLGDDQPEAVNDARHPAVTIHPETAHEVLYVNSTHTRKFAELGNNESVALIRRLMSHSSHDDNVYSHDWSVGDVLMWDQRATMHRGAGDYPPSDRRVKLRAIVQSLDCAGAVS